MSGKYTLIYVALLFVTACATPTTFNISNDAIDSMPSNFLGTYSDYGRDITYSETDKLHRLNVYLGGRGGCDGGAIRYAKAKFDAYMQKNDFKSYQVVRGEYTLMPLSKCELFVRFNK